MPKRRRSRLFLLLFLLVSIRAGAQDSVYTLSKDQFVSVIRAYHPVIRQAQLQVDRAKAEIRAARGAFDPTVTADFDKKTFDGKLYYSYFNSELVIPTWYGVDIKAGVEEVLGDRTLNELTIGKTSYLGVKVPATGLLFDRRRALLRQAQSLKQLSEAEQTLVVNDLMYDAMSAYWNWVREYLIYKIYTETVRINTERIRFIKVEYEQGARPAIDTTEALAQLQSLYVQQNAAWLAFQNAGLELSNFLWLERDRPLEWNTGIVPADQDVKQSENLPQLDHLLAEAKASHPKLQTLGFKIDVLQTERRLKAQYLLPKVSVSGNMLGKGYKVPGDVTMPFLENNYKIGADLSMPLFLREARGAYQAAGIKVQQTNLERDQTELVIENKVKGYYNEVVQVNRQIQVYEQAVLNYRKLLQGEVLRFQNGESTLFVLNSRENKVLEASQKLYELKTKWQKSYAGLLWAAGQLN